MNLKESVRRSRCTRAAGFRRPVAVSLVVTFLAAGCGEWVELGPGPRVSIESDPPGAVVKREGATKRVDGGLFHADTTVKDDDESLGKTPYVDDLSKSHTRKVYHRHAWAIPVWLATGAAIAGAAILAYRLTPLNTPTKDHPANDDKAEAAGLVGLIGGSPWLIAVLALLIPADGEMKLFPNYDTEANSYLRVDKIAYVATLPGYKPAKAVFRLGVNPEDKPLRLALEVDMDRRREEPGHAVAAADAATHLRLRQPEAHAVTAADARTTHPEAHQEAESTITDKQAVLRTLAELDKGLVTFCGMDAGTFVETELLLGKETALAVVQDQPAMFGASQIALFGLVSNPCATKEMLIDFLKRKCPKAIGSFHISGPTETIEDLKKVYSHIVITATPGSPEDRMIKEMLAGDWIKTGRVWYGLANFLVYEIDVGGFIASKLARRSPGLCGQMTGTTGEETPRLQGEGTAAPATK